MRKTKIIAVLSAVMLSVTSCSLVREAAVSGVKTFGDEIVSGAEDYLEEQGYSTDEIYEYADGFKEELEQELKQYEEEMNSADEDSSDEESSSSDVSGEISVTMLDVGQGLSILVESSGQYLLYDGGGGEYSSYVVSYLSSHGIDAIDTMVISHYDEDHISGLVGVLNTTEVETIYAPDYKADTKIYSSLVSAIEASDAEVIYPSQGDSFFLGEAEIEVVGPVNYYYEDENNLSVAVKITFGDFTALICGDAETESEADMVASGIDLDSDLYVVNHHGSSSSSSTAFLSAVSPDYAFISCGLGNSYGHPTQNTMDKLLSYGVSMFRSDLQGEVTAYSDGTGVWFSEDPCGDWSSGDSLSDSSSVSGTVSSAESTSSEGTVYVLNTSSKKFHLQSCSAVSLMSDSNKAFSSESRETLISSGYSACGICNP